MQNNTEFSPNQLSFEFNPNFSSVIDNELPTTEALYSDIVQKYECSTQYQTKLYYCRVKMKRSGGLRYNIHTYADVVYTNNDKVNYCRKKFKGWIGPAVVLRRDGQLRLVCHVGAYYHVHPCQVMKVQDGSNTCLN